MDRYEEALERAKQGLPIDEVFPELKESEDERIRKYLIDVVKDYCKGSEYEGCLAYLEKQKLQPTNEEMLRTLRAEYEKGVADTIAKYEQKEPLPVPDKFSGLKSLMLQYLQSAANRKDDTEIESDTDLWGRKILDYVWKHDEKQKDLEELTSKGFTISEFDVVGPKKVSDFEYIFTRDNIISRTYLKVSDIYPQEQPEVDLEKAARYVYESWMGGTMDDVRRDMAELGKVLNARKEE